MKHAQWLMKHAQWRTDTLHVCVLIILSASLCLLAGCASDGTPNDANSNASSSTSASLSTQVSSSTVAAINVPVMLDEAFGGVDVALSIDEFNALGFTYGDSVDVKFSNGFELNNIPYFSGYYVNIGDPLIVAYPGYQYIEVALNYGDPLWYTAGLNEGDTVTITLAKAGGYLQTQKALGVFYTDNRADYESDEQFGNFRAIASGNMTPGLWYRSASPIDNTRGRAGCVSELAKQTGISYILDLSDNANEIAEETADNAKTQTDVSYFTELLDAGKVGLLDLPANYTSQEFKDKLSAGLAELLSHDGPYLVHCVEGKDRTGFVCILLEALAGASYDEIKTDYMKTYDNYFGINEQSDPESYQAIAKLYFEGMLAHLADVDEESVDLSAIDYKETATNYLRECGMTDEQIAALVDRL